MNVQAGTPNWVDLGSPDLEATKEFYGGLFGWEAQVATEPEAGGYTMFSKDGKSVAGAGPLMAEGQPPAWTTYVAADDADKIAERVKAAGGAVVVPPMDVMGYGRMAIFSDTSGAVFAVWQAGTMPGGEVFNVPGALTWNELATRDAEGARAFYGNVFGWGSDETQMGPLTYVTWQLDGRPIGGLMPMVGEEWPTDMPPHWMVYFAVDDADAAATKAQQLGGKVAVPPADIPGVGRFAVLNDPHGAVFSILQSAG